MFNWRRPILTPLYKPVKNALLCKNVEMNFFDTDHQLDEICYQWHISRVNIKHLGLYAHQAYVPCNDFHMPSHYLYWPCEADVYCWENKHVSGWKITCPVWHITTQHLHASRHASTHWGQNKMAAIFQTTFSNAFSWMKMYEFRLRFHWRLFLRVQLTIFLHWFR